MLRTGLAFLAFIWPFAAAWLLFKLFPASLTKFVGKEIDRRSDIKLERIKAELQGSYSTLKTSVDVLTANSSEMRSHIVGAVSALWSSIVSMREKFGGVIVFDTIILASEAQEAFSQGKHSATLAHVRAFENERYGDNLFIEFSGISLDAHRLFCGDRLWLLFYIYRAVIGRSALLISWSFKEAGYRDWRKDNGLTQLLESVLPAEEVQKLRACQFRGLSAALARIEAEFLHEATRVMSGSKAMADSLADMQAMMLLQNAKVAQNGLGA